MLPTQLQLILIHPDLSGHGNSSALVQSGSCSQAYSSVFQVVVDPTSVGGTTSGGNTPICVNTPTGNINLAGHTGNVVQWQWRRDGGGWNNIANTTTTLNYTPTVAGTYDFRAEIKSGSCPSVYSTLTTIVVNPVSVGGAVTGGSTPICLGSSTGTMTLSGHTGTIVRWQRRVDAGAWSNIANTNATYSETPPLAGTWEYRAEVQSGACPLSILISSGDSCFWPLCRRQHHRRNDTVMSRDYNRGDDPVRSHGVGCKMGKAR
ncbi:MAG: hypothetical protein MZV63_47145 [Marinilabiliales bacterium]|nr:hypothetical protein [Marinilabiliales bacterium]